MRFALIQQKTVPGDVEGNTIRLLSRITDMPNVQCFLLPSGALCGAQPGKLIEHDRIRAALDTAKHSLAATGQTIVLAEQTLGSNNPLLLLTNGKANSLSARSIYEGEGRKLFGGRVTIDGTTLCVLSFVADSPCAKALPDSFALPEASSADIICLLLSFPFCMQGEGVLDEWAAALARKFHLPLVAVNAVGGQDCLVFPGQSAVFDRDGSLFGRAQAFLEDVFLFEHVSDSLCGDVCVEETCTGVRAVWQALVLGVRDFVRTTGLPSVFIGLSGGIDSALVAAIARDALGARSVTGVLLPSPYTSEASLVDARALAKALSLRTITMPITRLMDAFAETLSVPFTSLPAKPGDVTFENIQARIRGVLLCALANRAGGLVLNTSNKSEAAVGYSTLYGDTVGALSVIGDLTKTEVYTLSAWYCAQFPERAIPEAILRKAPSAELRPNQKDSDSLPEYAELDPALEAILRGEKTGTVLAETLRDKICAAEFKRRQEPPVLHIADTSFVDWHVPMAKKLPYFVPSE